MSGGSASTSRQSRRRAARAQLQYVDDFEEGIRRGRCGRGFTYLLPSGRTLRSEQIKRRIRSLAIPPAWEDVWICPDARGHIQARGRDAAGRLQYIYHEHWRAVSEATKFDRMHRFGEVLPRIRRRVRRDLNRKSLRKQRVLAAVVRLLDKGRVRVGSQESVEAKGATTLEPDDVTLEQFRVSLSYPSKSGQHREVELRDPKVAAVIRQCEELDGQYLFCYRDGQKERPVSSTDVNDYLLRVAKERVTAKDFRTWWGSVAALASLAEDLDELQDQAGKRRRQSACSEAIRAAADVLGNTPTVCRKSYVHPGILAAAKSGELRGLIAQCASDEVAELTIDEVRFMEVLPQLDFT